MDTIKNSDVTNTYFETCTTPSEITQAVSRLIRDHEGSPSFTTFSVAIYDTAWLSTVYRTEYNKPHWLFPKCFEFVLTQQQDDGTWPSYASQVDGILNTLAALVA